MSQSIKKQHEQQKRLEEKAVFREMLMKIVIDEPSESYRYYKQQLEKHQIHITSKRTLQREISLIKKNIKESESNLVVDRQQIEDNLSQRKIILSRRKIEEIKAHLKDTNQQEKYTKSQLIDYINEEFIKDEQKKISKTSKFVYLNFDGYYKKKEKTKSLSKESSYQSNGSESTNYYNQNNGETLQEQQANLFKGQINIDNIENLKQQQQLQRQFLMFQNFNQVYNYHPIFVNPYGMVPQSMTVSQLFMNLQYLQPLPTIISPQLQYCFQKTNQINLNNKDSQQKNQEEQDNE